MELTESHKQQHTNAPSNKNNLFTFSKLIIFIL